MIQISERDCSDILTALGALRNARLPIKTGRQRREYNATRRCTRIALRLDKKLKEQRRKRYETDD